MVIVNYHSVTYIRGCIMGIFSTSVISSVNDYSIVKRPNDSGQGALYWIIMHITHYVFNIACPSKEYNAAYLKSFKTKKQAEKCLKEINEYGYGDPERVIELRDRGLI